MFTTSMFILFIIINFKSGIKSNTCIVSIIYNTNIYIIIIIFNVMLIINVEKKMF